MDCLHWADGLYKCWRVSSPKIDSLVSETEVYKVILRGFNYNLIGSFRMIIQMLLGTQNVLVKHINQKSMVTW